MELFFDTETSDKFKKGQTYLDPNFPWPVQVGAILAEEGEEEPIIYAEMNLIVRPANRTIQPGAERVHNISAQDAERVGVHESTMTRVFCEILERADTIVAHNVDFDVNIMKAAFNRINTAYINLSKFNKKKLCCTMKGSTNYCKLPGPYGYKWPKLAELYFFLFNENFVGAHDAMFDIRATMRCYYELRKRGVL